MADSDEEPLPPSRSEDPEEPTDVTLGGYFEVHARPPAFEGSDGSAYSVSVEVERVADLRMPFQAYLVFPRWAEGGVGIVGHLETPTIAAARSEAEARSAVHELDLSEIKDLLELAIHRQEEEGDHAS